jgi:hypothetical protein
MTEVIPTTRGDVRIEDPLLARPKQKPTEQKQPRQIRPAHNFTSEERRTPNKEFPYTLAITILSILVAFAHARRKKSKNQ